MTHCLNLFIRIALSVALVFAFAPLGVTQAYADDKGSTMTSSQTIGQEQKADDESSDGENKPIPKKVEGAVGLVYVELDTLSVGETQSVAVLLNDETQQLTSATLKYLIEGSDTEIVAEATQLSSDGARFELSNLKEGAYTLISFHYTHKGSTDLFEASLYEDFNEACEFTVTNISKPTQVATDNNIETTAYVITPDGDLKKSESVNEALELSSSTTVSSRSTFGTRALSNMVIALDPGHGGDDPGATSGSLHEDDLNWKIAQYCKQELELYRGVTVFVTRGESETVHSLSERVNRAVNAGADLFVSIHINSYITSLPSGAEIYYPNDSSFKYELHKEGKELSQNILDKLIALGLNDRGIKTGSTSSKYSDGSTADNLGAIRYSRQNGILGILIEHGFISSESDRAKLQDENFLRKLGVADATGIAETYNLSQGYWEKNDNGEWLYIVGDEPITNTWRLIKNKWYYFNADGVALTGLQTIKGKTYYFNSSCAMTTGWQIVDGQKRYFTSSGAMQTGWATIGGKKYYFNLDGTIQMGLFKVDSYYLASTDGSVYVNTGWIKYDNKWYWVTKSGALQTGWLKDKGKWYYFNAQGVMQKGYIKVSGKYYLTTSGGACYMNAGWIKYDNKWYWVTKSGALQTGWLTTSGKRYYLDSTGAMKTGLFKSGNYYYLARSGGSIYLNAGWVKYDKKWYYITSSGVIKTGWLKDKGKWYYLDSADNGAMATGIYNVKEKYYIARSGGSIYMGTGWLKYHNNWYWVAKDGALQTGWLKDAGKWYYLDPADKSAMKTGWATIDGKKYYFLNSGAMVTGWKEIDNEWYYFQSSGALALDSWIGNSYVNENGILVSGATFAIMGESKTSVEDMVVAYNKTGHSYPAESLSKGGASTIESFCQIIYEEAAAEGVRAEVLFAQIMKETGWLKFSGAVNINQYNFGGLGATGNGNAGESFSNVRIGIRAQVQHLKAYASEDDLNQACVDNRFKYVARGCAPYVEWLGIQENPQGKGWAAAKDYGVSIVSIMNTSLGIFK